MKILLVEDYVALAQSIELTLNSKGFNVYRTELGDESISLSKCYVYDIILFDLNSLSNIFGYQVLKTLRDAKVATPVLILSSIAATGDKIKGLNFGADDYMTKPFHQDELVARIFAIVRRSKGHSRSVIQIGTLSVDVDRKVAEVEGEQVYLTLKEYRVLELLAIHKNTIVTREMFIDHLCNGIDYDEPQSRTVDVCIAKIRKKLAGVSSNGVLFIKTIPKRGYTLLDPTKTWASLLPLNEQIAA
ncbi:MAG: winged helix family two component transcriptional regulator [Parcubacteria group bacterium Gr01-1014_56]|nr:MAG: winged helix family two component transcriptional regulator [Parcubacteria group bacterium Gr01-1014_56]